MEDNQHYHLPQPLWCYKRAFEALAKSKALFAQLFIEHSLCLRCVFRIYGFEQPRLYYDPAFAIEVIPFLLDRPAQQLLKEYQTSQWCMTETCWACVGVLQRGMVNEIVTEVQRLIGEKGYSQWAQFKLNIRIPNIIILRTLVLARYLYSKILQKKDPVLSQLYYNVLLLPVESNKVVEHKTVLKWVLAHEICERTGMASTSDESDQNVVISVEVEAHNDGSQAALMKVFSSHLGLEKKKEKAKGRKAAIDLGQEKTEKVQHQHPQEFKCNANNLSKIIQLRQPEFESIFATLHCTSDFYQLVTSNYPSSCPPLLQKVLLLTRNVYLCGKYIKFSRYLSQTPWIVEGRKLTEGSLQEEIEDRIFPLFYPGRPKEKVQIKFHSGGREDIDVRMLTGGRPFVLEFLNPIRSVAAVTVEQALGLAPVQAREGLKDELNKWEEGQGGSVHHSWRIAKALELLINHNSHYVQVLEFQETTQSFISVELKAAETEKIKHYICYIHSEQALGQTDVEIVAAVKDLAVQQLTPLRVLHRRTLMSRQKVIHRLRMHLVSQHSAVLEVYASAGTYIKEFVHGDLGRTLPNLGSLLQKEVDILQLDVGSLKEGQWKSGDEELMKMDRFEWMD